MEAMYSSLLQISPSTGSRPLGGKPHVAAEFVFNRKNFGVNWKGMSKSPCRSASNQWRKFLVLSQCCKDYQTPTLELRDFYASFDKQCSLKRKAQEVASCLKERCIFLVGMMGSGKTTVGKVLAEALGYSFVDSDVYVEKAVGGTSVTQIFNEYGEKFFRDNESEALQELSLMPKQVVATGGGAVVRAINWHYMKQGITVYLDVPLDTLARRIAAVGTNSRPLLHFDSGDPYTAAFVGLFTISKKRSDSYANADARVSLHYLAANMGLEDISDLTPTAIAMEVLVQIEKHLKGNGDISTPTPA
ncbi:hypothetical protein SLE2022_328780 [Rubroshorea leprosula]